MEITKSFLERARFDFKKYADYISIKGERFFIRERESGMSPEVYAQLARDLLYIAVLCLRVKKYFHAGKLINHAAFAARQAAYAENTRKCVRRCELILAGKGA